MMEESQMYHYRYDCIDAGINYHVKKHPQQDLIDRNMSWVKSEPFSIADCWIFRFDHKLDDAPPYMRYIGEGFRFSDE